MSKGAYVLFVVAILVIAVDRVGGVLKLILVPVTCDTDGNG